jgi:hypothetical protein
LDPSKHDERFLEQLLKFQSGPTLAGVHDAEINLPLDEALRPRTADAFRNSNVMARLLYRSNERSGVPLKLSTGRRERCPSLVADKECAA